MNDLVAGFEAFDLAHPDVWDLFERLTFELIDAGRKHGSADMVLHRIRWDYETSTQEQTPKVNNNYSAFYSRKFTEKHQEHKEFFVRRHSKADYRQRKQVEMSV